MLYRFPPLLSENVTRFLKARLDPYMRHHDLGELADAVNCTNGVQWIYNVFGDCVDTPLKLAGFIIGLISLFLWLIPLIPQLLENYKRKRCESLSFIFLLCWIIGDMCNMLGAILTKQQPIQQIIGVYYICQDLVLLSQFAYYSKIYPSRHRNVAGNGSTIVVPMLLLGTFGGALFLPKAASMYPQPAVVGGRTLMAAADSTTALGGFPIFESYTDVVGYVIGSIASFCYFAGRIPQIRQNYYRKTCEGLSPLMFYIIVVANLTYGTSVLLESTGWLYVVRHLPWLAGSLGCCFFDLIILSQFYYYKKVNATASRAEDRERLLENED